MLRSLGLVLVLFSTVPAFALASVSEPGVAGFEVQGSPEIRRLAESVGLERDLGRPLTDEVVLRGVERLKKLGRAAAVKVDFRKTRAGTWICYRVRENPKIESIEFRGNRLVSSTELAKELAIRPGEILDFDVLYREVNRIPAIYLEKKGILYSGVLSPAAVTVDGGKVTVEVQEFKLRGLEVRGVRGRLKDAVLASLPLRRGQALRRADLLGGLFNVYQLPQVRDVQYHPRFDREKGEITLVLNLTEQAAAVGLPAGRGKLD